ncbi:ParB/RepB/Spo0J family partition protein [Actinokineospora bangkokensis]|uniref:ParB/Spo0J HTH domain-containing protein n=1 Tax=Actinokineospora bangkokensis TaxID=1193682 RepID=A0A1Q9LJW5_9PSEU|nr:ParB/RepB/Spo0J family partition protein [Actinokineospora bangkokensis]OLR92347.1 hypothetical protein BJP25_19830 [Actinokineospora bangkokensis]
MAPGDPTPPAPPDLRGATPARLAALGLDEGPGLELADGSRMVFVRLDALTPNPGNAVLRDEDIATDPDTHDLARSLQRFGQIETGTIVSAEAYLSAFPDKRAQVRTPWVLMCGNRRRVAAGLLGWSGLRCLVRPAADVDHELLVGIPIQENLHRKGINPMNMARWLHDELHRLGTQEAVAVAVGRTQPWVAQMLQLLRLIPELQAAVKREELTAKAARRLARLPEDAQRDIWNRAEPLSAQQRAAFLRTPPARGARPEPGTGQQATWVFRVKRSPDALAMTLVDSLSLEEIHQLIVALRRQASDRQ